MPPLHSPILPHARAFHIHGAMQEDDTTHSILQVVSRRGTFTSVITPVMADVPRGIKSPLNGALKQKSNNRDLERQRTLKTCAYTEHCNGDTQAWPKMVCLVLKPNIDNHLNA